MSKFDSVVDRLMQGRLLPFLGAGMSFDAASDDAAWPGFHRTWLMTPAVRTRVEEVCGNKIPGALRKPRLCANDEAGRAECRGQPLGLAEWSELLVDSLATRKDGQTDLVKLLRVRDFVQLRPTRAHRCLSFLAREGLVPEILTSNYDCLVERAWVESFGLDMPTGECRNGAPEGLRLNCACSLGSYRTAAATDLSREGDPRPAPRVLKLNGCARTTREHEILLTERSIQRWRERQWGADVLKDRLRCRSVLFCGFGSPEPQIRLTVGQVLEEFVPANGAGTPAVNPLFEEPNCPFVAIFGPPTFHQWQIVAAFRDGHGEERKPEDLLIDTADLPDHTRPAPEGGELPKLSADLLWEALFREVAERRLREEADPYASRAAAVLRAAAGGGEMLLTSLVRNGRWSDVVRQLATPGWDSSKPDTGEVCFSRLLHAVGAAVPRGLGRGGRYATLRDHGSTVIQLALLLAACGWAGVVLDDDEGGVGLKSSSGERFWVRFGAEAVSLGDVATKAGIRVVVTLDPDADEPGDRRVRYEKDTEGDRHLLLAREIRLPLRLILGLATDGIADLDAFARTIEAAVSAPSILLDSTRRPVRKRSNVRRLKPGEV